MAQKPTAKHTLVNDPQLTQLLQSYEGGLRAMQEHKYDKAKTLLQKVAAGSNRELADRAAVHLNACNQQLEKTSNQFKTAEEHYDYAVSLINFGDYVGAREHLDAFLLPLANLDVDPDAVPGREGGYAALQYRLLDVQQDVGHGLPNPLPGARGHMREPARTFRKNGEF